MQRKIKAYSEDVIRTAVSRGGDCDTLTCIAGSIAEGFYGVLEALKQDDTAADPQQRHIQFIRTVAPLHKTAKPRPDIVPDLPKPCCKAIHLSITCLFDIILLYLKNMLFQQQIRNVNGLFTAIYSCRNWLVGVTTTVPSRFSNGVRPAPFPFCTNR